MDLNGKIIVVEGTDGSGKQTQTALLKEKILKKGYEIYSTSFPNYDSNSSALVKMYLNGEITDKAEDVSAEAASTFYAMDRYVTYKKEFERIYNEGKKVLLFDRYTSSNITHQGAKIVSKYSEEDGSKAELELIEFVKWLNDFEHEKLGIPKPDVVIFLNVPIEYSAKLRENRKNKITGENKQDIHESDSSHLYNASKAGLISAKLFGWEIIECVKDGQMRTKEDISEEVWKKIQEL